ncbi:hypothetical protein SAMN05444172_9010 [Burkholderia sp. GAS332]|nr:hypothetical protein SAMN05444172_9010 [Burkholderia sp. GAS332]
MNRPQLKCIHCDTPLPSATRYCHGCRAELRRGAPLKLYVFGLAAAIAIGAACSSALDTAQSWTGWFIGLAALIGCWGLLDRQYADRVKFRQSRARRPDA